MLFYKNHHKTATTRDKIQLLIFIPVVYFLALIFLALISALDSANPQNLRGKIFRFCVLQNLMIFIIKSAFF